MIVKYVQPDRSGIQAHNFTRHSIGYVVRGKKCVYYGDCLLYTSPSPRDRG